MIETTNQFIIIYILLECHFPRVDPVFGFWHHRCICWMNNCDVVCLNYCNSLAGCINDGHHPLLLLFIFHGWCFKRRVFYSCAQQLSTIVHPHPMDQMGQLGTSGDHLSSVRCDGYPLPVPFFKDISKGKFQDVQRLETRPDLPFACQDR